MAQSPDVPGISTVDTLFDSTQVSYTIVSFIAVNVVYDFDAWVFAIKHKVNKSMDFILDFIYGNNSVTSVVTPACLFASTFPGKYAGFKVVFK
jgi:hypothetical protein